MADIDYFIGSVIFIGKSLKIIGSSLVLYFSLYSIIGLFAASMLLEIKTLWGINFGKFLPNWWLWVSIAIPIIVSIPAISNRLKYYLNTWSEELSGNRNRQIGFLLFSSIILSILWFVFRQKAFLLGDGNLRINMISMGKSWIQVEMGDFFIHSIVFKYFFEPFGLSASYSYHFISILSGVVFFAGAYYLARYLSRNQSLIILLAMLSSGMTVLFFGYVESYSMAAAFIPFLILSALKAIDQKSGRGAFIILLIIAGLLHSVIFLICFGALLIVLVFSRINSEKRARKFSIYLGIAAILLIIILYLLRIQGLSYAENLLIPLVYVDKAKSGLLSANHFINIVNWLLLSGLAALILFVSILVSSDKESDSNYRKTLLSIWIVIPSILFVLLFFSHLGGPRDWDLFSLPVFLLIPGAFILFFSSGRKNLPIQLLPAIVLAFFITVSFVIVNNSKSLSVKRFAEVIELDSNSNHFNEYTMLFSFAEKNNLPLNQILNYGLLAWQQSDLNKEGTNFLANSLGRIYIDLGDNRLARYFIDQAFLIDSADLGTHLLLTDYYWRYGSRNRLLGLAKRIEKIFPNDIYGLMNAGIIYLDNNIIERAGECLRRAFAIDSTNSEVLINYGIFHYQVEDFERCLDLFGRLSSDNPDNFPAYYFTAAAYLQLGKADLARNALELAEKIAISSEQISMVYDLKHQINNR